LSKLHINAIALIMFANVITSLVYESYNEIGYRYRTRIKVVEPHYNIIACVKCMLAVLCFMYDISNT